MRAFQFGHGAGGFVREAETGNSAPSVCAVQLHALSAAARYELESESEWSAVFVGVSVTIGDDLLFVCDDRCAKQPLRNQSRMMK